MKKFLHPSKDSFYAWIIWSGGLVFFFMQAMMRSIPNAIPMQLQDSLAIPERSIAILGSCFYGAYAFSQIPIGVLLDYWGPKRTMVRGAFLFGAGTLLFAFSDNLFLACMGRILTGMGGAVAFVGTVRLGAFWFTPYRLAIVIGITMGVAKLGGAFINAVPWDRLASLGWPWHTLVSLLSCCIFLLALILQMVLKDRPPQTAETTSAPRLTWAQQVTALRALMKKTHLWAIGGYAFFFYTFVTSFADVFAKTFLKKAYPDISADVAGQVSSLVLVGMCIGSPLISYLSNVLGTRRLLMRVCAISLSCMTAVWATYVTSLPLWVSQLTFFLGGVIVGAQSLVFITTTELMEKPLLGTASGVVNTVNMMSGFVVPLALKTFMECVMGPHQAVTLEEYQYSVYILSAGMVIAFFLTFLFPESFSHSMKEKRS